MTKPKAQNVYITSVIVRVLKVRCDKMSSQVPGCGHKVLGTIIKSDSVYRCDFRGTLI